MMCSIYFYIFTLLCVTRSRLCYYIQALWISHSLFLCLTVANEPQTPAPTPAMAVAPASSSPAAAESLLSGPKVSDKFAQRYVKAHKHIFLLTHPRPLPRRRWRPPRRPLRRRSHCCLGLRFPISSRSDMCFWQIHRHTQSTNRHIFAHTPTPTPAAAVAPALSSPAAAESLLSGPKVSDKFAQRYVYISHT